MVLDLSEFSYKMTLPDLCAQVRNRYMAVANQFVLSGDYAQKRSKYILRTLLCFSLCVLISAGLIIMGLQPGNGEDYMLFGILSAVIFTPAITVGVVLWQGRAFSNLMKQYCVKAILQDLSDIESLGKNADINDKNFIYEEDIRRVLYDNSYTSKYTDDVFVGKYKDTCYAINELKLYRGSGKHRTTVFEGVVMKANVNTDINGWTEILSKECSGKPLTYIGFFFTYIFVGIIIALAMGDSFGVLLNLKFFPYVIGALIIVVSAILAKFSLEKDRERRMRLEQQNRDSNSAQISANYTVRASNGVRDISKVITPELADVMDKLRFLFGTDKIRCQFYSDNVMLVMHSGKNLFEIGGLFRSPTNPKVAEPFIAQFTGIMLFMDYLTSVYGEAK